MFGKTAFSAICSDLANYPIASAVAASAAVPLVFSPIVLEAYPDRCNPPLPDWIEKARRDPNSSPLLRSFAQGIGRYRDGTVKYIKLLDGGLVDNFGLSGFTIGREVLRSALWPAQPGAGRQIRRVLFLIVNSGQAPQGDWARVLEGPSGADLVNAVTGAALYANVRASYTAFQATMENWRTALGAGAAVCRPPTAEAARRRRRLPRPEDLRRPHRLRSVRPRARHASRRDRDALPPAGGDGRRADRRRRRGAGAPPDVPGVPQGAAKGGIPRILMTVAGQSEKRPDGARTSSGFS